MSAGFAAEDTTLYHGAPILSLFNLIYSAALSLSEPYFLGFSRTPGVDKDTIPLPNYHESHRVRVARNEPQADQFIAQGADINRMSTSWR